MTNPYLNSVFYVTLTNVYKIKQKTAKENKTTTCNISNPCHRL